MPESKRTLIYNAHLFGPVDSWQPGWLLVEGRAIRALGPGRPPSFPDGSLDRKIDAGGRRLLPGFIDVHVHGAMGHEVMDASPDGLREMARFYARHGVTGFLATTWTATREDIRLALAAVKEVCGPVSGGATILGVHLEGPYLNPERCGAQDVRLIRRAVPEEAVEFLDMELADGRPLVRLVALAPEYEENLWLVEECARRGILVSAAHTMAGYEELRRAVDCGLRHVTHTYNAMRGLDHRDVGTVGAVMAIPELNAELIADNIHVHPIAQKVLMDVKTPQRVILVTDGIRGTGLPDGEYPIGDRTVAIRDGQVRLPDGTLAGSVLTMDRALKHAYQNSGRSLEEVWPMSSLNAARAIGVSHQKGSLEAGKDADLVLLNDDFSVAMTVAEGQIVYEEE